MSVDEPQVERMERGAMAQISRLSGVPYETVRRYYSGGNVGIRHVEKIRRVTSQIRDEDMHLRVELSSAIDAVDEILERFANLGDLTPDEQAFHAHVNGARERLARASLVLDDVRAGGGVHFATPEDRRSFKPLDGQCDRE